MMQQPPEVKNTSVLFPSQRPKTMSPDTDQELTNLEQLLDRVCESTKEGDRVSLDRIMDWVGRRSFGPLLLVAGLVTVLPIIGDIPGVPTIMGVFVVLIAGQLLLRRDHIWLPQWMLERSVSRDKLRTGLEWMRSPAQFIDRFLRPRLTVFTHHAATYVIAVACIVIAAAMPLMEVIPFSANLAGAALTAFGLSLIAHDGLLALCAFAFTLLTCGVVVYNIL